MKIAIGSDHIGFSLKQAVSPFLTRSGNEVMDVGPSNPEKPVDYPDYAFQVGRLVTSKVCERGILFCGTGIGMSIAANRMPGIRAALCTDAFSAHLSRAHNNANILCLGTNEVTPAQAEWIVKEWLETPFDYGRHIPRLVKLDRPVDEQLITLQPPLMHPLSWERFSVAMSPLQTVFGPVLFAGRLEEGLHAAAEVGFRKVELGLRDPEEYSGRGLDDLLATYGLSISAIATGQSCYHDNLCLCSPSADLCQKSVDRLKAFIRIGKRLGATVIIGGICGRLTGTENDMYQQHLRAISAIRDCASYGRELEVPMVLECINRYETNFICSVNDGLAVLDEIGEPNLKLLLDTFHMNIEEADISMSIRNAGEKLGYVHFSDSNRQAPGSGHMDFTNLLATLDSIDYTGTISTEVLPLPDDHEALRGAAEFYRSLIDLTQQKGIRRPESSEKTGSPDVPPQIDPKKENSGRATRPVTRRKRSNRSSKKEVH